MTSYTISVDEYDYIILCEFSSASRPPPFDKFWPRSYHFHQASRGIRSYRWRSLDPCSPSCRPVTFVTSQQGTTKISLALLLMATRNPAWSHQLRWRVVEIPLFCQSFIHPKGGWPWDFWTINIGKVQFSLEMEMLQEAVSPVTKRPPWGVSAPWDTTDSHLLCRWAFLLRWANDVCTNGNFRIHAKKNRFKILLKLFCNMEIIRK